MSFEPRAFHVQSLADFSVAVLCNCLDLQDVRHPGSCGHYSMPEVFLADAKYVNHEG